MDTPIDATVRLLKTTCHGEAGKTVTVSSSRARELVARRDAVFVDTEAADMVLDLGNVDYRNEWVSVEALLHARPAMPTEYILVRLVKDDQLKGTVCRIEAAHARRLIASGFAEEITQENT